MSRRRQAFWPAFVSTRPTAPEPQYLVWLLAEGGGRGRLAGAGCRGEATHGKEAHTLITVLRLMLDMSQTDVAGTLPGIWTKIRSGANITATRS
jgi:hypothetical protein